MARDKAGRAGLGKVMRAWYDLKILKFIPVAGD